MFNNFKFTEKKIQKSEKFFIFNFTDEFEMEKLFNDLESLNGQEQENAKRELAELFSSSEFVLKF